MQMIYHNACCFGRIVVDHYEQLKIGMYEVIPIRVDVW